MKMSNYKVSEPSALKFLKANGAVVDENGNVISDSSDYWKKVYDQAEPKVAKYLHADGTIDENPGSGGGSADLEDNKTATIDVSTYTEPVEIEPTAGKDGMKKATVILSNIPSGGMNRLYAWGYEGDGMFTISATPSVGDSAYAYGTRLQGTFRGTPITEVTEDTIKTDSISYTRNSKLDINPLWG